MTATISRRQAVEWLGSAVTLGASLGCKGLEPSPPTVRLAARPGSPTLPAPLGQSRLGLGSGARDGLLYVPRGYLADRAWPLLVALHGAGGSAEAWASYPQRAEDLGFVFLAPDSRGVTWDLSGGTDYRFDPPFIDRALQHVFDRCRIDSARIVLAGFSDGASYSLSLGVSNGDLFSRLIGYSPGFLAPGGPAVGKPPVFISHGTADPVLPVSRSRDVIVPSLRGVGYEVTYREFTGGHEVPGTISAEALTWALP